MNNNFDFDFWKIEIRDRFDLNRVGSEILTYFIYYNPTQAQNYIRDLYQSKVEKYELIDKFCNKYDSEKINSILNQIEFDELTEQEIQEYEIKKSEEEENEEL